MTSLANLRRPSTLKVDGLEVPVELAFDRYIYAESAHDLFFRTEYMVPN